MHILTTNCINIVISLIHSVILTCRPLVTMGPINLEIVTQFL